MTQLTGLATFVLLEQKQLDRYMAFTFAAGVTGLRLRPVDDIKNATIMRALVGGSLTSTAAIEHKTVVQLQAYNVYDKEWQYLIKSEVGQAKKCNGSKRFITLTPTGPGTELKIRDTDGAGNTSTAVEMDAQSADGISVLYTIGEKSNTSTFLFTWCSGDAYTAFNKDTSQSEAMKFLLMPRDLSDGPVPPIDYEPPDVPDQPPTGVYIRWYVWLAGVVLVGLIAFGVAIYLKHHRAKKRSLIALQEKRITERGMDKTTEKFVELLSGQTNASHSSKDKAKPNTATPKPKTGEKTAEPKPTSARTPELSHKERELKEDPLAKRSRVSPQGLET